MIMSDTPKPAEMNHSSNGSPWIEGVGLALSRNDRYIFTDLNFSLAAGQILQVEGHNGSGKTTMLRILCGLTLPSEGEIRWCGEDIRKNLAEYYAQLAYVGHAPGIKGELTPLENLELARSMSRPRKEADAEQVLERLQLPAYCDDVLCHNLSAGQRRRVALGRLLMLDARLWVLDEPFTALDPGGRKLVEELLSGHAQEGGMAVLTTHHVVNLEGCIVRGLQLGT